MLESLKRNIESWRTFPLSMVGRVNAIKMVTLPRFLYLFQNLPVSLPKSFFKALDSIILPFVWGFKAHRISKLHVCKPRSLGGLGLPNFQHYYWAANCRALSYWKKSHLAGPVGDIPSWLAIEQSVTNHSLSSLLFAAPAPLITVASTNFILCSSFKIWCQIRKAFKLPSTALSCPIACNHAFKPSLTDSTFSVWSSKGMVTVRDLYVDGKFATFSQLKEKYDLPPSHFLDTYS